MLKTVQLATSTGGGTGTVTNIATGLGLTGGPITTTGTISMVTDQLTLGNATLGLGNTTTTVGNLTLNNVTINTGNATVTTGNLTYANVITALRTQGLTGYLYGNANTGNVTASTTIPNNGLANSTFTLGNATVTLGGTTTTVGNLTLAFPNITGTTGTAVTFATSSLPLVPEGYITVQIGGASKKIPYYGV